MNQEPLVKIGTILTMSDHKMPVKAICADSVIVQHQGLDLPVGRVAVEKADAEAAVTE